MKLAVCSYALNQLTSAGTMDLFGYLETCKYRYGLQAADLWNGTLVSLDEAYLAKVKAGLEERELTLADICIDGAHIWEDDPGAREANHQNALAHLRAAEFLGARTVRIDAGGGRQAMEWRDQELDEIVKRYREYAQRAYDNGYKVEPENHWGAEVVPTSLKRLCEAVDHPAFGVLLHAGRWRGPEAEKGDEILVPWVMHTHFAPGSSDDELAGTMTMLRDAGYEGFYSVEMNTLRYTEVAVMLARIRDVGDQWRLEAN
jgi:sugar phosphate isomerase/epimerase